MRPNQARFVSVCQQMLVLGAVFAVLVPAASVISLDVITSVPRDAAPWQSYDAQPPVVQGQRGTHSAFDEAGDVARDSGPDNTGPANSEPANSGPANSGPADFGLAESAPVESAPVEAVVEEHPMETEVPTVASDEPHHGHDHAGLDDTRDDTRNPSTVERDARGQRETAQRRTPGGEPTTVVSSPEKVRGYGAVGVTWSPDSAIADGDIAVEVRTRSNGAWSEWMPVEHHAEHGPDPTSTEGGGARPGTDALIVGDVEEVQARATTEAGVDSPDDLRLAVVAPGQSGELQDEAPAIDTEKLRQPAATTGEEASTTLESDQGEIALRAATTTKKPQIFSRAQWGANEKMRSGSPSYYEVHAGFVHHTVNSNNYTKAQVPGIIRSIYAYHTKSRGWSDIGYNFLVDKFGRIWEGRAGGVDRPVVGAHTLNYNSYSFAMSAIGNFDIAKPGKKVVNAYARLMAWKLSLHGVEASSTRQQVGSRRFAAINGHRDAAATACPGRHLYAELAKIRTKAAKKQSDWSGRELATDLVGSPEPDLLLGKKDGEVVAVPTGGMLGFDGATTPVGALAGQRAVVASPDLTGDGRGDLVVVAADGSHQVLPGTASGGFAAPIKKARRFAGLDHLTAAGDLDGDGKNDMVGRNAKQKLLFFAGKGNGAFKKRKALGSWAGYDLTAATGDLTGDGLPDILARDAAGKLWLHPGTGRAALGEKRAVNRAWGRFDVITGYGDVDGDGKADLLLRRKKDGRLMLRPGNGKGGFQRNFGPLDDIGSLSSVTAAAVAGSARPALVGLHHKKIVVRAHNGKRNVAEPVSIGTFPNVDLVLNAGDWDRDGQGDIITRHKNGKLRLHRGLGNDRFAKPKVIAAGFDKVTMLAAVGDVTGDGHPDLMGQPTGGAMRVYPGTGGGLGGSIVARSAVTGSAQLGIGRWDSDGAPDVFIRSGDTLQWYQGNGPGGLTGSARKVAVSLKGYDLVLSPGDLNGDGRQDLVLRTKGKGTMWLLPGKSNGFGARTLLATGFKAYDRAG